MPKGIFCGNFGLSRGSSPTCHHTWCGACYKENPSFKFHRSTPLNDEGVEWRRKKKLFDFVQGFDGATLNAPFQCDYCWFYNLRGRVAISSSLADEQTLAYIRRVSLDVLWARSPATARASMSAFNKEVRLATMLNIDPNYPHPGPWPVGDNVAFSTAMVMLAASQERGLTDKSYVQFETIRKLRTGVANWYETSSHANSPHWSFKNLKGQTMHLSKSPTESRFFVRFAEGVVMRMGRDIRSNTALDHNILLEILRNMDGQIDKEGLSNSRREFLIVVATYLVVGFCGAMRGNEGFMLDLGPIRDHITYGKNDADGLHHVVVCLLGRFKGEMNTRWHMVLLASITESGLNPRYWLERLIRCKERHQQVSGPAILDSAGFLLSHQVVDEEFHTQLEIVQDTRPDLISDKTKVRKDYGIFRSLKRGWATRAKNLKLAVADTDSFGRWRAVERAKGLRPSLPMREHYAEIKLLKPSLLRCSASL